MSQMNNASDDASRNLPPVQFSGFKPDSVLHPLNDALRKMCVDPVSQHPISVSHRPCEPAAIVPTKPRLELNHGTRLVAANPWALDDIPIKCKYVRDIADAACAAGGLNTRFGSPVYLSRLGRVIAAERSQCPAAANILTVVFAAYKEFCEVPSTTVALRISTHDSATSEFINSVVPGGLVIVGGAMRPPLIGASHWDSCLYFDEVILADQPHILNPFCFVSPDALPIPRAEDSGRLDGFCNKMVKAAGFLQQSDMQKLSAILLSDVDNLDRFALFPASANGRHPGAHHAVRHGLAVHTVQVVRSLYLSSMHMRHDELSRLMLLGWLHDISKIQLYAPVAGGQYALVRPAAITHEILGFIALEQSGQYNHQQDSDIRDALLLRNGALYEMVRRADALSAATDSMDLDASFLLGGGNHVA